MRAVLMDLDVKFAEWSSVAADDQNSREYSMNLAEILGFVGTGLVAVAYIPQIRHLIKEHCSAGISVKAYILWFMASVFFLIHAAMITDAVFIGVQLVNLGAICVIVTYSRRYEKQFCETHLALQLEQR
jgi:uncharacterized protein with PQ loop repeat